MKLAAKLVLIFLLGVLAIVSLFSWQTIRRQHDWEEQRRCAHAGDLAETLSPAIEQAYEEGGTITIQRAVETSTRHLSGPKVRWIDGNQANLWQAQTRSRQTASVLITDASGNRKAYSYIPMQLGENVSGAVEVAEPLDDQDAFTRESVLTSVLSLIGVAAFSGVVIFFGGVQMVGKPLNRLISQVNQIGDGNLDQSPVLTSNDELGRLAGAISQMSHRLSQQRDTIRHTDRLGTIGTLAAGMAHELGTPLNVVAGRASLIKSGKLTADEVATSAETIHSEAERMTKIIRQLLDFARQAPSPHESIDLVEVVKATSDLMRSLAEKANARLITELPGESLVINGDAAQIQQVVTNLITNAISAMPDGGSVTIALERASQGCRSRQSLESDTRIRLVSESTSREGGDDQDRILLKVTDTGVGIDPEDVRRVFEPFFTTKDIGEGTGLGLSIAYGIVREHDGDIEVDSRPGEGTTFTISFPSYSKP